MGRLAPVAINLPHTTPIWPDPAPPTPQMVRDKLVLWRENLLEHDRGTTNCVLTRVEIIRELDRWLDHRLDQRGR